MNPLRIAIAGLGTVGCGTVKVLQENAALIEKRAGRQVVLTAVSARHPQKERGLDLSGVRWVDDALALADDPEIDVVVELIGGAEGIARELCEKALAGGKAVVTANKALLATHGAALAALAEEKGVCLSYEAAVGGGIPVIKTVREALAGNQILSVRGILNGTCNYILTRMAREKMTFAAALLEAQNLGYAEADPAADVDGYDTAHKTTILASLAFGIRPDLASVSMAGLRQITPVDFRFASELGYRIKMLGAARRTDQGIVEQRVGPCLVPEASPLALVDDVLNAVQIEGDAVGPLTLVGRGAGAAATASAVVGDLTDLARGLKMNPWGLCVESLRRATTLEEEECTGRWYIRLQVTDQAGVLAAIAAALRDEAVSIETLLQHGRATDSSVPLIIVTHETSEGALRRALTRMAALETVWEEPFSLRMEEV